MIDREEAHRRLDALLDAAEREQAANSNEARAAAQAEFLAAEGALDRINGKFDISRRRMMVEALALPSGSMVNTTDFERFARDGTPGGQIRLRHALARHEMDSGGMLTDGWVHVLAGQWLLQAGGRYGPLDGPVRASGIDLHGGPAAVIRLKIVADAGYTVGVEFGNGAIPRQFWKRAQRAQNALAQHSRMKGYNVENLSAATIKGLCLKDGLLAVVFRDCRRDGKSESGAPNPDRIILAWLEQS
jgi:hypothetical protein